MGAVRWTEANSEDSMARQREPQLVEQVRQAIQDSPLSLLELGQRSGVNQSQLSRFLHGERGLTLAAAAKVCEVLGLELAWRAGTVPPARTSPRPGPGRPPKATATAAESRGGDGEAPPVQRRNERDKPKGK
jgi:transcriptional regulator with XRE-family HTH domain